MTKAESNARKMAERLESTGVFDVTVKVEHHEAEFYSSGEIMSPAWVIVHVSAKGKRSFDDSYSFSWVSYLPAKGHRARTKYIRGDRIRMFTSNKRSRFKKLSLQDMDFAIQGEVESAYNRKQRAAEEVG